MWPEISDDPLYVLLREENIAEFNKQKTSSDTSVLTGKNYRGLDLREMDVDGLDLRNAYFRGADLRGLDFSNTNLEGASLAEAKLSGCLFPKELRAEEIRMSVKLGTRLRYDA